MKLSKSLKNILLFLFVVCIAVMLYLVFTPQFPLHLHVQSGPQPTNIMVGSAPINFVPFQEITNIGFWLNIIMTMPVGGLFYY